MSRSASCRLFVRVARRQIQTPLLTRMQMKLQFMLQIKKQIRVQIRQIGTQIRAQSGNTLLEILLVLALFVVLFAVLVPSLNRLYQHEELDAGARMVAVQVRTSQMAAVANQMGTELRFGNFTPGYSVWENSLYQGQVVLPARIGYKDGFLSLSTSRMQFNPDGTLTDSGVIRLVNQNHEEADVSVQVTTGVVQYGGVYSR